jgi:hypothetical protein
VHVSRCDVHMDIDGPSPKELDIDGPSPKELKRIKIIHRLQCPNHIAQILLCHYQQVSYSFLLRRLCCHLYPSRHRNVSRNKPSKVPPSDNKHSLPQLSQSILVSVRRQDHLFTVSENNSLFTSITLASANCLICRRPGCVSFCCYRRKNLASSCY